jgi:hypothetical protein
MAFDKEKIYDYIQWELVKRSIKYEISSFESGAVMIDIWADDGFYVVQIDTTTIGISKIDDNNPGFDTRPDELFYENERFMKKFDSIF